MHLVTGKAGSAHITAENHRRLQAGTFGSGRYILEVGSCFAATIATANTVEIADGVLMMDGAQVEIEPSVVETVTIDSASAGSFRHDIVAVAYAKDGSGCESAALEVIAGAEAASEEAAALPTVTTGNILDGDTSARMALYDVLVEGTSISSVTLLASTKRPAVDRLDGLEADVEEVAAAKEVTDAMEGKYIIFSAPFTQSVELSALAAGTQGAKVTASVTLPSGADSFFAVPMDGGYIITNGFGYIPSKKTVSFYPINVSSRSITGAVRFLVVPLKKV